MSPAAAWYSDPMDPTQERWFDGTGWTPRTQPIGGVATVADVAEVVDEKAGPTVQPWETRAGAVGDEVRSEGVTEDGKGDEPAVEAKVIPQGKRSTYLAPPEPVLPKRSKLKKRLLIAGVTIAVAVGAVAGSFPVMDALNIGPGATPASTAPTTGSLAPVDTDGVVEGAVAGVTGLPLLEVAQDIVDEESDVVYDDCADVIAAGAAPITIGDPGYVPSFDEDGDGVACE
jgi:hypothetical protein